VIARIASEFYDHIKRELTGGMQGLAQLY